MKMPEPAEDIEADGLRSTADEATSFDTSRGELAETSAVHIAVGIIVAGGLYPALLVAIYSGIVGVAFMWHADMYGGQLNWAFESVMALWTLAATVCVLGLCGLVWTGVVCLITLPVLHIIAWTLRLRGSIVLWGAFCGGLVGFLAVLPFLLTFRSGQANWSNEVLAWTLVLLAGPGITTVMGQLGGAWGGQREDRIERLYNRAMRQASIDRWTASRAPSDAMKAGTRTVLPKLVVQFGIRHLLWIAVWLSILFSVIRLSGVPFEFAIPLLLGWLIYQTGTLWIGWRLWPKISAWLGRA